MQAVFDRKDSLVSKSFFSVSSGSFSNASRRGLIFSCTDPGRGKNLELDGLKD